MSDINKAAKLIDAGELVVFPTETVYGIGADATNQDACLSIFQAKGRPAHNPLIVHVASVDQAKEIAVFNEDANKIAQLWPGPISMVLPLKASHKIAKSVTAGLETIALRVPAHPMALDLINRSGKPIAAPSANISGKLSSTTNQQAREYFSGMVHIMENNISCEVGLESTIIDLTTDQPVILRHGFFTKDFLSNHLLKNISFADKNSSIKAPGMMLKHYAPKTKLRLNANSLNKGEVGLNFGNTTLDSPGSINLSPTGNLNEAAINLYKYLHQLDIYATHNNHDVISVAPIPQKGIGLAINDRLQRASE
ncbi:MAG: hypothetical protein DGJ47_000180 [Rickettsiaceae bacterium]